MTYGKEESQPGDACQGRCWVSLSGQLIDGVLEYVIDAGVVVHRDLHGRMVHQLVQDRGVALAQRLRHPATESLPQLVHRQFLARLFGQQHAVRDAVS